MGLRGRGGTGVPGSQALAEELPAVTGTGVGGGEVAASPACTSVSWIARAGESKMQRGVRGIQR